MAGNYKKIFSQFFSYSLAIIIFLILVRIVWHDWQEITNYSFIFNPFNLLFALIFGILNVYALAALWRYLFGIVEKGTVLSGWAGFRIFFYAWFSRYLPGRFWAPLSKIYIGAKEGVGKKSLGLASVLELLLSTASQFILVWIILVFIFRDRFPIFYYTIAFVAGMIAMIFLLHPRVLSSIINFGLKKIKKNQIDVKNFPGYGGLVKVTALYFLPNFFVALSFVFLARSFYDFTFSQSIFMVASFILANFLSKVAFFVPVGIGVREGLLVAILQFFLPLSLATMVSLLSRVWFIALDCLILGGVFLADRYFVVKK